ncbi:MAG TPA: four helix bundle protein [Nitrospirae bacterium]|nr:four helix bundle protein [Nitrospirota bacterium]
MKDNRNNKSREKADEIQDRLIDFAVTIIKLAGSLPKTPAGIHIAGQILRSGTSPAPNYGEARGAESLADFIHKLGIVLKELNETSVWLQILLRGKLTRSEILSEGIDECNQLSRIIASSVKTSRSNRRKLRE